MDYLKSMGEKLRRLRNSKAYPAGKVGDLVGITTSQVYGIESGNIVMPYSVYEDICRVLGTTFSEIMAGYRWTYSERSVCCEVA